MYLYMNINEYNNSYSCSDTNTFVNEYNSFLEKIIEHNNLEKQTIDYINSLPTDIEELNIAFKNLSELPDLSKFTKLKKLNCSLNNINILNNLPIGLTELYCSDNNITELNNLPNTLIILDCSRNNLTNLNGLPNSLQTLFCDGNML